MQRLLASGQDASDADIAAWYGFDDFVGFRSNMVMSADGAAVDADVRSGGLSGAADTRLLGILRGVADAVVVAAGTVRAEGYAPVRARSSLRDYRSAAGMSEHPVLVIVTRTPALDPSLPMFAEAPVRPVVLCAADNGSLAGVADVVACPADDGWVDLRAAQQALASRGLARLHTEGGPHLLGRLLAAGLLEEYCITISPQLVGTAAALRPVVGPAPPTGFTLVHAASEGDFLFLRYRRASP